MIMNESNKNQSKIDLSKKINSSGDVFLMRRPLILQTLQRTTVHLHGTQQISEVEGFLCQQNGESDVVVGKVLLEVGSRFLREPRHMTDEFSNVALILETIHQTIVCDLGPVIGVEGVSSPQNCSNNVVGKELQQLSGDSFGQPSLLHKLLDGSGGHDECFSGS
jgi:hypothetical protein